MKPYSSGTSYPQPLLCNKEILPKYSLRTIRRPNCNSSPKGDLIGKLCTKNLKEVRKMILAVPSRYIFLGSTRPLSEKPNLRAAIATLAEQLQRCNLDSNSFNPTTTIDQRQHGVAYNDALHGESSGRTPGAGRGIAWGRGNSREEHRGTTERWTNPRRLRYIDR